MQATGNDLAQLNTLTGGWFSQLQRPETSELQEEEYTEDEQHGICEREELLDNITTGGLIRTVRTNLGSLISALIKKILVTPILALQFWAADCINNPGPCLKRFMGHILSIIKLILKILIYAPTKLAWNFSTGVINVSETIDRGKKVFYNCSVIMFLFTVIFTILYCDPHTHFIIKGILDIIKSMSGLDIELQAGRILLIAKTMGYAFAVKYFSGDWMAWFQQGKQIADLVAANAQLVTTNAQAIAANTQLTQQLATVSANSASYATCQSMFDSIVNSRQAQCLIGGELARQVLMVANGPLERVLELVQGGQAETAQALNTFGNMIEVNTAAIADNTATVAENTAAVAENTATLLENVSISREQIKLLMTAVEQGQLVNQQQVNELFITMKKFATPSQIEQLLHFSQGYLTFNNIKTGLQYAIEVGEGAIGRHVISRTLQRPGGGTRRYRKMGKKHKTRKKQRVRKSKRKKRSKLRLKSKKK
jgi:hypothetical protein